MPEHRIRVAVIGAGLFAEQCHIPGVQAHPRAEVVALCARNRERVTALADRMGVPDVHTDYHELLARPDIDAVTVATPDALHLPVVLAALAAGKHVFCEKPLALNADEAQRMADAAAASGLVAMMAFTFRYTRALPELRRLLRAGTIGTPFAAMLQVYWGEIISPGDPVTWREQAGQSSAGIFADAGTHLFDALAYALAPVQAVCAQLMIVPRPAGEQPDSIDLSTCLARLRLPDAAEASSPPTTAYADRDPRAVHVTVVSSRVHHPQQPPEELQVVGTSGTLSLALTRGQHEQLSLRRAGSPAPEQITLPADAYTAEPLALTRMMGAFVDAVLRGHLDEDHDPSFAAGLHAQCAVEAGIRSAQSGHWEPV